MGNASHLIEAVQLADFALRRKLFQIFDSWEHCLYVVVICISLTMAVPYSYSSKESEY